MKVSPISSPLPGEHLVAISPKMQPEPHAAWHARLNFWTGRALTEQALQKEQANRAARLAWRGRLVAPGVVAGLDVALETRQAGRPVKQDTLGGQFVHIMPGYGLMATGEDVYVPRPLRVDLDQVPVIYGERIRNAEELIEPPPSIAAKSEVARSIKAPWFNKLDFGDKVMRWHMLNRRYVPWAAVLLLRPVTFHNVANRDDQEPCQLDPSHDAFDDPRLVDGSQLLLFALPQSLRRDELLLEQQTELSWRNRLVSLIFRLEIKRVTRQQVLYHQHRPKGAQWMTALVSDDLLPWEYFGVPIGLIGFEPDPGQPTKKRRIFLDRNSVVRIGGRARPRPRPAIIPNLDLDNANPPGSGTPAIWQARVAQFNEHLQDLLQDEEFRLSPDISDAEARAKCLGLIERFRYLPPAGLLPRAALHFLTTAEALALSQEDRADTSWFFPSEYSVRAVPVVKEEVEALVAASAPLSRYDLKKPEPVCVLVPMPENQFDPDLLKIEKPDPAFQAEVARLFALRQDWRQRRDYVQGRRDDLSVLTRGGTRLFVVARIKDADQLESEPTETLEKFPLACEIIPPAVRSAPWKIDISFSKGQQLKTLSRLAALLHLDEEHPTPSVELQWRLNNGTKISSRFDSMPPVAVADEIIQSETVPRAISLRRNFERSLAESGLGGFDLELQLVGVTVILTNGRAALAQIAAIDEAEQNSIILWRPRRHDMEHYQRVDGWQMIAGPLLLAPFEDRYKPLPADGTDFQKLLDELSPVLTELTAELKAMDPRLQNKEALSLNDVGLERLIQVMTREVNKAAEVVELSFDKVQAYLQRLQSVIAGETDAGEALKSPAVSAMTAVRGRNVAKTQINESLAVNPNWTTKKNIKKTSLGVGRLSLDDTMEMQPRLLKFTHRFAYGPAYEAYQAACTAMREVLKSIANLNIGFDDDEVPEILESDGKTSLTFRYLREKAIPPREEIIPQSLFLSENIAKLKFPITSQMADDPTKESSSGDIVAKGIHRADVTMAILRKVENYISRRHQLIERANIALDATNVQINDANLRMTTLNGKLAEVRHDLAVARALWQDELDRVAAINARRDELIARQVKQLAYVRPRCVNLVSRDLPSCEFDRADALPPIPASLQSQQDPPEQLENYLQLFRHAPVRWFRALAPLLRAINTRERLMRLLEAARQNAGRLTARASRSVDSSSALARVYTTGYALIEQSRRRATEQMIGKDMSSWEDNYQAAIEHASLGDLMDGAHGRNDIAAAAAQELVNFGKVAACLHAEFAAVLPGIRMAWVERYSQFDRPAPLRDITVLPRAESLPRQSRKRFQAYLDWIFDRIDQNDHDAVRLVNDLVRMCLLLASHAPVNRLILGHVPRPVPVRPGFLIPVQTVEPHLVRVGMQLQVWRDNVVMARGTVENLRDAEVAVRINETHPELKSIETDMRIQFMPNIK